MARATEPDDVHQVLVDVARRLAPWPTGDEPGRSVVEHALTGDAPPVRASAAPPPEPST